MAKIEWDLLEHMLLSSLDRGNLSWKDVDEILWRLWEEGVEIVL